MNTTTEKLDNITQGLLCDLHAHPFGQRFYAGDITRDEYVAFLVQTYHYVLYTRPLLRQSGERLVHLGKTDLAQLFLQKADEENGHEQWVLRDLRAIGEHENIVHRIKPVSAVAAYIAWNSYTAEHGSPIAFLGAAYVLEAMSAARAGTVAKNLVTRSGINGIQSAVKFLAGHADADVEHIVILGRAIEAFATLDIDREEIMMTAAITRSSYAGLCTAIDARRTSTNAPGLITHAS